MGKFYRCADCWRIATHSIGYFDQQTHYCNKHWLRATATIERAMKNIVIPPEFEHGLENPMELL